MTDTRDPLSKPAIADELTRCRERTLELVGSLGDDVVVRRHAHGIEPILSELVAIGAYEHRWLVRELAPAEAAMPLACARDATPSAVLAWLDEIRVAVLDVLGAIELGPSVPLLCDGFVYRRVLQHEEARLESILEVLQHVEPPGFVAPTLTPRGARRPFGREVLVPGGSFILGASQDPSALDHERPAHAVDVAAFFIDATPVTNDAFARFIACGGYAEARWWTEDGWAWREKERALHPAFWRRDHDGSWSRLRFGHREPLPGDEPVCHVSWYEADAYARWAGKRLPTEAEWEKAASWGPWKEKRRYPWGMTAPGASHANLDGLRFGPASAFAYPLGMSPWGAQQMLGDVWEWTSSPLAAYPGFVPFPEHGAFARAIVEEPRARVLRGGSWATGTATARTTARRWADPGVRRAFTGLRCARIC